MPITRIQPVHNPLCGPRRAARLPELFRYSDRNSLPSAPSSTAGILVSREKGPTLETLGIAASEELVRTLLAVDRAHDPAIALLPDSEQCLRSVTGKAFVGVISDGAVVGQQMKVGRLGLAARCNHIILTESIGVAYSKPHPRAFLEMQRIANCTPRACTYFADNPIKDFIAPNRLGWRTIRLRRPGALHCGMNCFEESQPSIEIEDLSELPALLSLA